MLKSKIFEIRDDATYIPVLAIKMAPDGMSKIKESGIDAYHLQRAGYDLNEPLVTLLRLDPVQAEYDPLEWAPAPIRTMREAHRYIQKHFDELEYGAVIDVEYILGIRPTPKKSERYR